MSLLVWLTFCCGFVRVVVRSNAAPLCGESLTPPQGLVDVRAYHITSYLPRHINRVIVSSSLFSFFVLRGVREGRRATWAFLRLPCIMNAVNQLLRRSQLTCFVQRGRLCWALFSAAGFVQCSRLCSVWQLVQCGRLCHALFSVSGFVRLCSVQQALFCMAGLFSVAGFVMLCSM